VTRLERITSDPSICHGRPTIRGLRHPVENLLELLASGMTIDEIVADHPERERDDLLAALEYAAVAGGPAPAGAAGRRLSLSRVTRTSNLACRPRCPSAS